MNWWCGCACGVVSTLIVVTLVAWIVDESVEMQSFDDAQEKKETKPNDTTNL